MYLSQVHTQIRLFQLSGVEIVFQLFFTPYSNDMDTLAKIFQALDRVREQLMLAFSLSTAFDNF